MGLLGGGEVMLRNSIALKCINDAGDSWPSNSAHCIPLNVNNGIRVMPYTFADFRNDF